MKLETIPAADVELPAGKHKYAAVYARIDALGANEALRITFDSAEDMAKFRNASSSRYPTKAGWLVSMTTTANQVVVMRRLPIVPDPHGDG